MQREDSVNILLVDDDPIHLSLLENILKSLRQNLISVSSGELALEKLQQGEFAIILLDVNMPGMNGFQLAEQIRSHPQYQQTPLIFLSGVEFNDISQFKGYELGAVDYLPKPINIQILRSKVAVFVNLFQEKQRIKKQAEDLSLANQNLHEQIHKIQVAEQRLSKLALNLETIVQERTIQLRQSHLKLQKEIQDRQRIEEVLQMIALGFSAMTGSAFFHSLVEYLAKAEGLEYAFVAEFTADQEQLQTVAFYGHDQFQNNLRCDYKNTPCHEVLKQGFCAYPNQVSQSFKDAPMLQELGIESYVGILLVDSQQQPLGILAVMATHPLKEIELTREILNIFAVRTELELERQRNEKILQESEALYRLVLSNMSDAVFITDDEGYFTFICPNAEFIFGHSVAEMEQIQTVERLLGKDLFAKEQLKTLGELNNIERVFRNKAGEERVVLVNVKQVCIHQGTILYSCRDITERKQIEAALIESEERFRNIVNTMGDALIVMNKPGKVYYVNPTFEEFLGVKSEDIIGCQCNFSLNHNSTELVIEREDKKIMITEVKIVTTFWDREEVYLISLRDITQRKQIERKLYHSLRDLSDFKYALDQAGLVVITNTKGVINYANDRFYETFEYSREEVIGKTHKIINSGYHDPQFFKDLWRTIGQGKIWRGEVKNKAKDGSIYWLDTKIIPFLNEQGKPWQYLAIRYDITERKQAEEALKEREEQFRQLAENIRDVFFIHDAVSYKVLYISPAFEKIWGMKPEDTYQDSFVWMNTIHPEDQQKVIDKVKSEQQAIPSQIEYRIVRPNQEIRWIRARSFPVFNELGQFYRIVGVAEDITDRKHAEKLIREREQRYENLINNLHAGVVVHRPDTQVELCNAKALELLELTLDQMLHKTAIDPYWHFLNEEGDILPLKDYPVNQVIITQKPLTNYVVGVYRPISKTLIWVLVDAFPDFDDQQKLRQVVVTFLDITSRKQAQEALRDSERRYGTLTKAAPVGIFQTDAQGYCLYVNKRWRIIAGLSDEQALGLGWFEAIHPDDRESLSEKWNEAVDQKKPFQLEYRFQRKNGKVTWVYGQAVPEMNSQGVLIAYIGTITDITDRKQAECDLHKLNENLEALVKDRTFHLHQTNELLRQEISDRQAAEEALRDNETFLRNVIDTSPNLIFVKNWEGQYILANQAMADILGTTVENIEGKTYSDFIVYPQQIEKHEQDDRQVLECLQTVIISEESFISPSGKLYYFQIIKTPLISADGKAYNLLGVATDITERKQAEEKIEKALAREKELNQMKTQFIDIVSHEFRTPLTSILGYAELLERHGQKFSEEKKLKQLKNIITSAKRLNGLIEDVLSVSRADAGKIVCKPMPLNLDEFCQELLEEIKVSMGKDHQIDFLTEGVLPDPEISPICLDEKLLRHILINLLSNAIKYSPQGSQIEFYREYQPQQVIFHIKDHGIGIPIEDQTYLFNSFHRASNVGNIPGTGLGLNIVQKYVELHGGMINYSSEVGVGTTFRVSLPLHKSS